MILLETSSHLSNALRARRVRCYWAGAGAREGNVGERRWLRLLIIVMVCLFVVGGVATKIKELKTNFR